MITIKKLSKKRPVYDLTVEKNHNFYANNILVKNCDEMTVVSPYMRQVYEERLDYHKITVLPNYAPKHLVDVGFNMDKLLFNYKKSKNKKPRILYAGSAINFDISAANICGERCCRL